MPGEVGLVSNHNQFFGVAVQPNASGIETAYLRYGADPTAKVSKALNGAFKLDTLYVAEMFVDSANDFRLRLWEEDDPSVSAEITQAMPADSWTFRARANGGSLGLDAHIEGTAFTESQTDYQTIVQYTNGTS